MPKDLASAFVLPPEDYDPRVDDRPRPQHVPVRPKGELKKLDVDYYRDMPVMGKVSNLGRTLGQAIGASPTHANRMGEDASNLVGFVPGVGDALSAVEAKEDLLGGNYGKAALGAGLTAIGLIPGVGDVAAKAGREGVETIADDLAKAAQPAINKPGYNKVSANKLLRPYDEMTASYAPGPPLKPMPEKPFDFESDEDVPMGSWLVGLLGDKTPGGQYLTGVNDIMYKNPVLLEGGGDFLRRLNNPDDAYWAAAPTEIEKYVERIRPLQETGDVFGTTVAMGAEGGDFSRQTLDTILETIRQKPLSDEAKTVLDKAMREQWGGLTGKPGSKKPPKPKAPAYPDWPGIDKVTPEWWAESGNRRAKFAKLMDSGAIAKLTGIDMGSIRKAITHPELRGASATEELPGLATGHRIFKAGPEEVRHITDPTLPHSDYASQLAVPGGQFVGGAKPIPGVAFWQDWYAGQKPGSTASHLQRSAMTQGLIQRKTPEWVDRLRAFKESDVGKRLGLSGAIALGLITASEAKEMFGYEGENGET